MTATLLVVLPAVALVAFGFWRVFRPNKLFRSSADTGWENENFAAMEATGTWAEDTLNSGSSTAPMPMPGLPGGPR